jgi:hypothetical protein
MNRVLFFGCKVKEGLTLVGVFMREPFSLAKKGTLTPEKKTLMMTPHLVVLMEVYCSSKSIWKFITNSYFVHKL